MKTDQNSGGPLVSVYLVNHNYGRFIKRAIDSVLAQTMRDYELLIIDDGSTDDSHCTIGKYADRSCIVTIFQKNRGLNVTNNIALRAARGKYIMRLDADDWLDEHALQVLSGILEREPAVGLVFPDYYLVDIEGRVTEVVRRHNFDHVTLRDKPAHGACTMIRRNLLQEIGGYDESFRCQDGYDIWLRFVKHAEVRNVNLPLFYYRQHNTNLTQNETRILDTRARIIEKRVVERELEFKALAVIPVRGQVVDPRSQALRSLAGKTLIDWTVEAALASSSIEAVLVSTPDPAILTHIKSRYGDKVLTLFRDRDMAQVNTFLDDTLRQAGQYYLRGRKAPQAFVALYVESPFRQSHHIDTALDVMALFETDSVIGVRPETDMFYQHDGHGLKPVRSGRALRLEAEEVFREVGDLKVATWDWLMNGGDIPGGRIGHVVLDQKAALSVMSEWDWQLAEILASEASIDETKAVN